MPSSSTFILQGFLLFTIILVSAKSSFSSSSSKDVQVSSARSFCQSTPFPDVCFNSLNSKQSVSLALETTLQNAASEAEKLNQLLETMGENSIVETKRGALQDCRELHQITVSCVKNSITRIQSPDIRKLEDARTFLSAALTNKETCLEGLDSASGPAKQTLVDSTLNFYKLVSNSLSIVCKQLTVLQSQATNVRDHLGNSEKRMKFPDWLSRKSRRLLQSSAGKYDPSGVLTVVKDGSGNFTTIIDAINFAPNNSKDRVIIYVREGVYQENVDIPSYKTNIVLLGYGSDVTVVTGNRSVGDGWGTYGSATVAVSGQGFLARDITFQNTAGPGKYQAVALRINADFSALYRCVVKGYQATLYVHSFRQFYRDCDIIGTVDFIFGNAAAVFQSSNIISTMPLSGQYTVVTAQSRDTGDQNTGISIQNCSVLATNELYSYFSSKGIKSYLGRPWRNFSRVVYLDSFIDDFIDPSGWIPYSGNDGLDTLYYGEYNNYGPGSGTDRRVIWPGYHVMDYNSATNFTVSQLIAGHEWLDSTGFPYDDGV